MNVVSRLILLSLFAVGAAGAEAAAEGAREPLVEQVRAANARFGEVSAAVAEGYAPIPRRAASTAVRWASTTSMRTT
jgi:hypothetical protein